MILLWCHTHPNNGKGIASLHPRATRQAAARICKASHQLFREYTESYIFKPVHSLSYPLVVVIDLDEWEDHWSISRGISHCRQYNLLSVSQAITGAYFNHNFENDRLENAKTLFICHIWISSRLLSQSKMRLRAPHALQEQIISSGKQAAFEGQLGNLYRDALKMSLSNTTRSELFQRVFGAMTRSSLSDFACLLGLSINSWRLNPGSLRFRREASAENIVSPASQYFHSSFLESTADLLFRYSINSHKVHLSSFGSTKGIHSDLRGLELYAVEFWSLFTCGQFKWLLCAACSQAREYAFREYVFRIRRKPSATMGLRSLQPVFRWLVRMEMRLLLVFDKDEVVGFLENNVMNTALGSRKTCSCCTIARQTWEGGVMMPSI